MTIYGKLLWKKWARRRGPNLLPKGGIMYVITREKSKKIYGYKGISIFSPTLRFYAN